MITIVGAGAMGGWLASSLSGAGNDVTVLDVSEELVSCINQNGLQVETKDGTKNVRLHATSNAEDVKHSEMVFFFVKAHHTKSAAELARPFIGPDTIVVSLQNGWGNADTLASVYEPKQIVVGVTYHSATVRMIGHIAHTGVGQTFVGPYQDEASLDMAHRVGALLEEAGVQNTVTSTVKTEIWKKLILNAATLPTSALAGLAAGDLGKHQEMMTVVDAITEEAVNVARAQGYDIEFGERKDRIHSVLEGAGKGKSSMLQDAEARRKTEIEVVNGAVVRAAEKVEVPVPLNRVMVSLIHGLEQGWNL